MKNPEILADTRATEDTLMIFENSLDHNNDDLVINAALLLFLFISVWNSGFDIANNRR